MDVIDQTRAVRSRWILIVIVVTVGLVATAIFGHPASPKYAASHTLLFKEEAPAGTLSRDAYAHDLEATAALARSPEIVAIAKKVLHATNTPADLATKIQTKVDAGANTITIVSAPQDFRSKAKALVDVFAGTLQGFVKGRSEETQGTATTTSARPNQLAAAIKALNPRAPGFAAQQDALLHQYADAVAAAARATSAPAAQSLVSLGPAVTHQLKSKHLAPNTVLGWMLAAGVLGFLGGAVALVVERFDRRIRRRGDAEVAFGLPVLAEIPPLRPALGNGHVVAATHPQSGPAEAYRTLRSSLPLLARAGAPNGGAAYAQDPTAALVTSPEPGDGATTTAVNLAASVAETGRSVLIIDCNLRTPSAHRYLGVPSGPGLSEVLSGGAAGPTLDQVAVQTSVPGVRLVAAGAPVDNPAALFAGRRNIVALARLLADFIVLDAPPLTLHEAADLVWMVDAVIVSCRAGGTTPASAVRAGALLGELGAPPRGVVLLDSTDATPAGPDGILGTRWRPERLVTAWLPSSAAPTPAPAKPAEEEPHPRRPTLPSRRIASWGGTIALMVVLWFAIRAFLFLSFYIPSPSMSPALKPGDRVLVSKLSYRLHDINRGDIVVFKRPPHIQAGPEVRDLVKRVIGLPGDMVEARDGHLVINGRLLTESYVGSQTTTDISPRRIPAGHYWVMGDNRAVSEDSRYFGAIPRSLIVGRVFFQVWPVSHVGFL